MWLSLLLGRESDSNQRRSSFRHGVSRNQSSGNSQTHHGHFQWIQSETVHSKPATTIFNWYNLKQCNRTMSPLHSQSPAKICRQGNGLLIWIELTNKLSKSTLWSLRIGNLFTAYLNLCIANQMYQRLIVWIKEGEWTLLFQSEKVFVYF